MKYVDEKIKKNLIDLANITGGHTTLESAIHFSFGYYGCVTEEVWWAIEALIKEGVIHKTYLFH